MNNKIKDEFKDFISTLSIEICKEVLLEDLKAINNSFNETATNYKELINTYTNNINSIKDQLNKLQDTNTELTEFITNANINNEKVNMALNVIKGTHKKVIDNILVDNQMALNQYNKKVQILNESERKQFISALTSSLDVQSEKYITQLKELFNSRKFEDKLIQKSINMVGNKINDLEAISLNIKKNIESSEEKIIEELNSRAENSERETINRVENSKSEINNKIDYLNNTICNLNNVNSDKILKLNKQLNRKINIILVLNLIFVVISVILTFIK